ncbi:MAG: helix-hairpin-helix domain-containing protein, partial [Blastocatellia bacterium]
AYSAAADAVEDLKEPISDFVDRGGEAELQKIPGIGKAISKQIVEFVRSRTCPALEELTKDLPLTVLELTKVSGIGLKTAQVLFRNFGIKGLADLKTFADGGGLKSVPGLGEKTTARVLRSIERLSSSPVP